MTPTDALATALEDAEFAADHDGDWTWNAKDILAALPEGTAFVTVDSLAAALRSVISPAGPNDRLATAIIQAAKEAERE